MEYVIVYLIKGKLDKYQQKLVKTVGPMFGENYMIENPLPAHVTLKSPFKTNEIKKFEELIREFSKKQKISKIKINKFGNFNGFVTFLKTDFSKEGKKVQKDLVKEFKSVGIKPHEFDIRWKPHATISYGNTKKNFDNIWNYLKKLDKPEFNLKFNNITLLKKVKGKWIIHKEFKIT